MKTIMMDVKYQPLTAVWEVTMGCNMRCKHCGSSCTNPLPDELTTEEAIDVISQMRELGLKWVTLSGGEPLTRKDVFILIEQLSESGIKANLITNGFLLEKYAEQLKEAGISTLAVSIDGPERVHDTIRMQGSFERSRRGIQAMKRLGVTVGAITTITKQNLELLPELREELINMGVDSWQVQIGLPMGNLSERPDWVIDPEQVDDIIEFCYETAMQGRIKIYPADCIGYFNNKELEVRRISFQTEHVIWDGCNAGVRGFGLLHNGDILGCTSIRSREFVEGSIRERPLSEIWNGDDSFAWRRQMKKTELSGTCAICVYGSKCLGGCPNTRLTMEGSIYGENKYCSYNNYYHKLKQEFAKKVNAEELFSVAQQAISEREYQKAALLSFRLLEISPDHQEGMKLKGFAEYMCGNYSCSKEFNQKVLQINPDDVYAIRGFALANYKLGMEAKDVLALLERAKMIAGDSDPDLLHDIKVIHRDIYGW